jgi:polysaccharide export outer membrane protein
MPNPEFANLSSPQPEQRASLLRSLIAACVIVAMSGCAAHTPGQAVAQNATPSAIYQVGPLDSLDIFVWRMPDLSRTVTVRPDGRISLPLIDDLVATGKTPTTLARDIEQSLAKYVEDPTVTVIVGGFHGPFYQQVRIIGEATDPQALAYQANMSVLDVMIAVHGLTRFASGNRAELVRVVNGQQTVIPVRLDDLIKDGDVGANMPVEPGDVLIIPQAWF